MTDDARVTEPGRAAVEAAARVMGCALGDLVEVKITEHGTWECDWRDIVAQVVGISIAQNGKVDITIRCDDGCGDTDGFSPDSLRVVRRAAAATEGARMVIASTERAGSDVVAVWKERALRAAGEREIARDKERIARQAARNAEAEAIEFGSALEVAEARVAALEVERDAAWIAGRDAASIVAADDEGRLTVWGEDRNTRVAQQTGLDIAAHIRALQPPTATAGDKTDAG